MYAFFLVHAIQMCSRNPPVTLSMADPSHCGAMRIVTKVAQPFLSDRSRCGEMQNLISLAQPSPHFVRVGWLPLWRGTDFS